MILLASALVFAVVVTVVVGGWWVWSRSRRLHARVGAGRETALDSEMIRPEIRVEPGWSEKLARKSDLLVRLTQLSEQAGRKQSASDLFLLVAALAAVAAFGGWWRIGTPGAIVLGALLGGSLPVLHLVWKRNQRMKRLDEQFVDAVDMIARSIRAGNALTAAIQLVAEEMPEPTRGEFQRVADEIRLGLDASEALGRLQSRVPTEDVKFFCAAVNIQRGSGGNLAEILDRLSDVIRKRFELLSHARVLSSQQRYSAMFVGASPIIFAIIFYFVSPGFFDPLFRSAAGPTIIGAGLVMEAIGFFVIWRLAQIKV